MNTRLPKEVMERVISFEKRQFPKSLSMLGLEPGFTNQQFEQIMCFERSDQLRKLAHQEWENEQKPEYDNSNWRWHLSYVSMNNDCNDHYKYIIKKRNE